MFSGRAEAEQSIERFCFDAVVVEKAYDMGKSRFCDIAIYIVGIIATCETLSSFCFELAHGFAERKKHRSRRNCIRHGVPPELLARRISK
ncbi:MAG TPA: hypothetical protein VHW45_00290 [Candidatus Sulfotelmatobacter sp.]|jgi:hypothetical protein|nr:hypothetical protein [Candidatus Sulfotelmatobacter sp.]